MKKIFLLIASIFIFSACDDGDITLESFNFSEVDIESSCITNHLHKINDNELLLLEIPFTNFANTITPANEPRVVSIGENCSITYRIFSGEITNSFICATIPPATPIVEKEWQSQGGTVEIITTERRNTSNELVGYNHSIYFKNVNFAGNENSFSFESYFYGVYQTTL